MQSHVPFWLAIVVFEVLTESFSVSHLVANDHKEEFLPTCSCLDLCNFAIMEVWLPFNNNYNAWHNIVNRNRMKHQNLLWRG